MDVSVWKKISALLISLSLQLRSETRREMKLHYDWNNAFGRERLILWFLNMHGKSLEIKDLFPCTRHNIMAEIKLESDRMEATSSIATSPLIYSRINVILFVHVENSSPASGSWCVRRLTRPPDSPVLIRIFPRAGRPRTRMSVLGAESDSFVQMLLACKTKGATSFPLPAAQLVPRGGSCNRVLGCLRVLSGAPRRKFFPGICGAAERISRPSAFIPARAFEVTLSFSRRIISAATWRHGGIASRPRLANFRRNR